MAFARVVGQATSKTATADSTTLAYPASVTSGNLLLVMGACWQSGGAPTSITVSDSRGFTWSVISAADATDFYRLFIAYAVASSSGACTVTVNPAGASSDFGFCIDEFSGQNATPLDVDGSASTTAGNSTSPADSITTLTANDLVTGVMSWGGTTTTVTKGASYTQIAQNTSTSSAQPYCASFAIVTTATAYSVDYTLGATRTWRVLTAAFKEAAGGGPVTAVKMMPMRGGWSFPV